MESKHLISKAIWLLPLVVAAPLGLDTCLPGIPQIMHMMSSSPGVTQWIISGFLLCMSLSQLVFGPLVDTWGAQKIFMSGGVLYIVGLLGAALTVDIQPLILLRLLQGIGAGAMAVSVFSTVPLSFHGPDVGKVFSLFNGMISLVPVTGPIIGGFLIIHYGWQSTFWFVGVFVLLCVTVAFFKPLPKRGCHQKVELLPLVKGYGQVIRSSNFQLGCFASSYAFATQLIFFSSAPVVLIDHLHVSVDRFGYYFAVNAMAISLGSLLTSKLLGKVTESKILFIGATSLFVAMVGFLFTSLFYGISVWGYIIPSTIGSFGFALLMGAGASVALSSFKSLAGTASALMAAVQMSFASLVAWWVMRNWSDSWIPMIIAYCILSVATFLQLFKHYYQAKRHCCKVRDEVNVYLIERP